jgi:hypothetical protein
VIRAVDALVLRFSLDDLRRRFAGDATAGADPRHDAAPFRAFRAALLDEAARQAVAPATLSMRWEGTFNDYSLCVTGQPADALPHLAADAARVCEVEDVRVAPAPPGGYPLAVVGPGRAEPARDEDGALWEAPFGAPTGHFGAPGMRRVP